MSQKDINRLKLFNEKAERLLSTRFVEFIRREKRFSFKLHYERKKGIEASTKLPDQDAIDAFVLTFRYFIQNNEKCSFGNLAKTYSESSIPTEMRKEYFETRNRLNEYLDSPSSLRPLTRKRVLDIFVYGGLAHANPKKKKIFDKLRENAINRGIAELEFASILFETLRIIRHMAELNAKVIAKLEAT